MVDEQLEITNIHMIAPLPKETYFLQMEDVDKNIDKPYTSKQFDAIEVMNIEPVTQEPMSIIEPPEETKMNVDDFDVIFERNKERTCVITEDTLIRKQKNIIIDNSVHVFHVTIEDGVPNEIKKFHLLYNNDISAHIITSQGSFYVHAKETNKKIVYIDDIRKWKIIGSPRNCFFPDKRISQISLDFSIESVSVDESGTTLCIGSYSYNECIGCALVYEKTSYNWELKQILQCNDNLGNAFFGVSVCCTNNQILVGGSNDNSGLGACWLYVKNGDNYIQKTKLIGSSSVGMSHQGSTTCMYGDTIIIGGQCDNNNSGAIWIFVNEIEKQKITSSNNQQRFGRIIRMNDSKIFIVGDLNEQNSCVNIYSKDELDTYNLTNTLMFNYCKSLSVNGLFNSFSIVANNEILNMQCVSNTWQIKKRFTDKFYIDSLISLDGNVQITSYKVANKVFCKIYVNDKKIKEVELLESEYDDILNIMSIDGSILFIKNNMNIDIYS